MPRIALYPGSFDPLTHGHLDIITRAAKLADRLIVAIGVHHGKKGFLDRETRKALILNATDGLACPVEVLFFDGLAVEAARAAGASMLVRGLRGCGDLDYESPMAAMNSVMAPDVETVFLAASPDKGFISSTLVRQIATMGGDIKAFVPPHVARAVALKLSSDS
ncbi:MAG TPA: pantetheine-phosphate adenylyltransferase [Rhodobacteraceae bacterium]|nr:pantetheine-phosphate adenylyltransferase [Paracoccaceae bacterium]